MKLKPLNASAVEVALVQGLHIPTKELAPSTLAGASTWSFRCKAPVDRSTTSRNSLERFDVTFYVSSNKIMTRRVDEMRDLHVTGTQNIQSSHLGRKAANIRSLCMQALNPYKALEQTVRQ